MTFTYSPLSKEDADKAKQADNILFQAGVYNFKVIKSTFKMSNTGENANPKKPSNPMIELVIKITDSDGNQNIINDFLVGIPNSEWKTRAFCEATNTLDAYESHTFNENICLNLNGKAFIKIKPPEENKKNGGFYPERNAIGYYISRNSEEYSLPISSNNILSEQKPSTEKVDFDDDIPF